MIDTIRVDLHCHSSMSDGDHSPSYVAHSIAATGAVWAALTDHNSLEGQDQFRTALSKRGVRSVTGLEIDARSPTGPIHLLGYGFDPQNEPLLDALRTIRQPWRTSLRNWMVKTRSLRGQTPQPAGVCAPEEQGPQYRPPSTTEAICLIHEAGGLVFLAHPLAGLGSVRRLEELINRLQPQGLDGLEAFHKQYPPTTQGDLLALAERRDLLTIAGSDFHGLHHSDGSSPGVDMPLVHWNRFADALGVGENETPPAPHQDQATTIRGHVGH